MLKENNKVLKCSNASPDWRGYVDFVNDVLVDGMSRVICASLEHLLEQVRHGDLIARFFPDDASHLVDESFSVLSQHVMLCMAPTVLLPSSL